TLCGGIACSKAGTWSFNLTVNFASYNVNGSANMSSTGSGGSISDFASVNQSLPGSGPGQFSATSGSGGVYNFTFKSANGQPAATLQGTATFDNGSDKGSGTTLTAPKSDVPPS